MRNYSIDVINKDGSIITYPTRYRWVTAIYYVVAVWVWYWYGKDHDIAITMKERGNEPFDP